jgi:hypothetical protein
MTVTLATAARNAAADAVVDLLDAGATSGKLIIKNAGGTKLAELVMDKPAFGAATAGVATASTISDDASADATGTAATFEAQDSDGNVVYTGSVGTSGEALNLNTTAIVAGTKVSITALTYTQPAS